MHALIIYVSEYTCLATLQQPYTHHQDVKLEQYHIASVL